MPEPEKRRRNKAIVHLYKCGWKMYSICKLLKTKDKRNFLRVLYRDYIKYFIPTEKGQEIQKLKEEEDKLKENK